MRVVIVGSGPAGVTVAETLRQRGSRAEILMFSEEPYPPYSPPAMAEYFMTGRRVHYWKGEDFPQRLGIDHRPGVRVVRVDPKDRKVFTSDGEEVGYDFLVLASGGRLYAPLEGADKPGIYNFKSLSAAEALIRTIRTGQVRSALIVGAGFIGVEIALLLRHFGLEVTMLVRSRLMRRMLDPESAQIVQDMLRERGIKILTGEAADAVAFVGKDQAEGVQVRGGEVLYADCLIAATGLRPNVEFLEDSGIPVNWGVVVDEHLRAGFPNVYAAGDVAETVDLLTGERSVSAIFPNAVVQGRVVALNILGMDIRYEGSEAMNSLKHLQMPVVAVGSLEGEEIAFRSGRVLRKVYLREGRIVGFRFVGDIRGAGILRSLMRKKVDVRRFKEKLPAPDFGMGHLFTERGTAH